ncbi:MAG: hypothetical protein DDT19_00466 [Syntrophomonadaceae bacterium]|nr:hypothetical protein [Bacillota bacterium]
MEKLSQRITEIVCSHAEHGVTLGDLLEKIDRQGIGFLLALLSLPLLVPLPPGVGSPMGILLLVWSFQRLLGIRVPWCPAFLRRRHLSPQLMRSLATKGVPLIQKLERFGGGRNVQVGEPAVRIACLVVMLMSSLIILPTPFLNPLFATVILLIGISLAVFNTKLYAVGVFGGVVVVILLLSALLTAIMNGSLLFVSKM